jgi:hypothetical protein
MCGENVTPDELSEAIVETFGEIDSEWKALEPLDFTELIISGRQNQSSLTHGFSLFDLKPIT